jgi:hypothetical protein
MTLASSNRASLRFIEEITFGTTPATPAFKELRYTGESLNYNIENIVSEEIRSDRMTTDLVQVSADGSGDVNVEVSYDTYDDFLAGVMASTWSTPLTVSRTDISATTGTNIFNTVGGDFVADGVVAGQWIEVRGFTNDAINGYYRVASVTASDITTSNPITASESAGNTITMGGAYIRNGTELKSYSVQKQLEDISPNSYFLFNGVRVGQLQLAFETNAILTGIFSLMGLGATVNTTGEAGQTTAAAPTTDVMNAVNNVLQIEIDNTVTTAYFNTLNLNINNNLRAQDAIGSLPHVGIALSRLEITGDVEIYFQDNSEYTKYLNATAFSLAFRVEDAAGNAYIFTLPRCKYETGEVVAGGLDQDIFQRSTIRAIRDATTNSMIQIDKFAA